MGKSLIEVLETQELIDKLIEKGYGNLVDAFLSNESKVYTKKNRVNKSGACRVLGWKPKQLDDTLAECQALLGIMNKNNELEDVTI